MAKSGPSEANDSLKEFVSALGQLIEGPLGRGDSNPEQIESTENAIRYFITFYSFFDNDFSAVAKIMQHRPDVAPLANWLERWISWLPVYEDREESANCYSFIAQILNGQGVSINVYSSENVQLDIWASISRHSMNISFPSETTLLGPYLVF